MPLVPEPRRARWVWLSIILVVAVAAIISSFIRVERRVAGACMVQPAARWTLTELRPGSVESRAIDMVTGQTLSDRLYQFDRQAFVDFELPRFKSEVDSRIECETGQVVASVSSSTLELNLAKLTTDLEQARAHLDLLLSGAKAEEIDRAEMAVEQAKATVEAYRPTYERHQKMHEQGILSEYTWDEVAATLRRTETDVALRESELRLMESGAHPKDIEEAAIAVAHIEAQIEALEAVRSNQVVRAPISGWLRMGGPEGSMVTVSAIDTMVVEVIVPQRQGHHPQKEYPVRIRFPGMLGHRIDGYVTRVDRRAFVTAAGPYVRAYVVVPNPDGILEEGMEGRAWVLCGKETLLNLVVENLVEAVRKELWPL